mgnify:CR=1 FL=1
MARANQIQFSNSKKQLAVLVDPDKASEAHLSALVETCVANKVDYFFVGGSLMVSGDLSETLSFLKAHSDIPCILFPGSFNQVDAQADAILMLSLISGRNPELLIGEHVKAAPFIAQAGLQTIPTGYLLIEGVTSNTALYMSQSLPIPMSKPEISGVTALAGTMLGLQNIYIDAGSGADRFVPVEHIKAVKSTTEVPLICGGGVQSKKDAEVLYAAGADVVVVGNVLEDNPALVASISEARFSVV